MKLRILTSAIEDLSQGRMFYDLQGDGLGVTFSTASFPRLILCWFLQEFIHSTSDITGS